MNCELTICCFNVNNPVLPSLNPFPFGFRKRSSSKKGVIQRIRWQVVDIFDPEAEKTTSKSAWELAQFFFSTFYNDWRTFAPKTFVPGHLLSSQLKRTLVSPTFVLQTFVPQGTFVPQKTCSPDFFSQKEFCSVDFCFPDFCFPNFCSPFDFLYISHTNKLHNNVSSVVEF